MPDFVHTIGIGAQKSASSWVYDLLKLHPGVAAADEKEVDFFSARHDRGHAWYRDRFRGPGLRYECSPSYLIDPRAPARARAFNPDMRMVAVLRDPVARAYSHHLHEVRAGHILPKPFGEALRDNPEYLDQGLYARHLSRWFEAFGRDRIQVLFFEDIAAAPQAVAATIFGFLDLPPGPILDERRNVSDRARVAPLRTVLRGGGDMLRRVGAEGALLSLKRTAPVAALLRWNSRPLSLTIPPLDREEKTALRAHFRHDVATLSDMLGGTPLPWPGYDGIPSRQVIQPATTAPGSPRPPTGRRSASAAPGSAA